MKQAMDHLSVPILLCILLLLGMDRANAVPSDMHHDTTVVTDTTPQTPSAPPRHREPAFDLGTPSTSAIPTELKLPPLKAVLLVGPIDGDSGAWTSQEKENMDLAAAELQANGVTLHTFYTPDNDWETITSAARGAHFLLYRGHGVYWGNTNTSSPPVGGFALKDRFISNDDIRMDLELAPNAIVMLYGCFTAGTSSNDSGSISSAEAQRRVAQYADPFFDIGAAGYYASWYGDAFQKLIHLLFQGQTLQETYESFYDFNPETVERYTHLEHPDMALWLDKEVQTDLTQYSYAFAGRPDSTLADLFQPVTLELYPQTVTYLAEPSFPDRAVPLTIAGNGETAFTWRVAAVPTNASWLSVYPLAGTSGESLTLEIVPTAMSMGTYHADIQIVTDDTSMQNRNQIITVTLRVVERVSTLFLPLVQR